MGENDGLIEGAKVGMVAGEEEGKIGLLSQM